MTRGRDSQGKRVAGYGRSPEEADADLAEKLLILSTPLAINTFHDAATQYWLPRIHFLKPLTVKRYIGAYVNHIRHEIGHLAPDAIKPATIQAIIRKATVRGDSTSTCSTIRSVVSQILRECEANDLVNRNVASSVSIPKKPPKRVRVLSVDQAATLLESVDGTSLSAPVFLASILGLCRGEVCALKWTDLDRQRGELTISRQRIHGTGSTQDADLKREARHRVLRLTPSLIAQIDARGDLDNFHICTHRGKMFNPNTLGRIWKEFSEEEENKWLADWHYHDLRHGAAGLLYAAGCDLLQIAAVLGHAKPDMSLVYTDMGNTHRKEAVEKLSQMLALT